MSCLIDSLLVIYLLVSWCFHCYFGCVCILVLLITIKFDIHFTLFCCVLISIVSFWVYGRDYCWIIFCGSILFTNFDCLQCWSLIMLKWLTLHISSNPWMDLFTRDLLWIVYVRQVTNCLHTKTKFSFACYLIYEALLWEITT